MTYKALYTKVLLKLLPPESNAIIVNETESSIRRATVVSIGEEVDEDIESIQESCIVYFYLRDTRKLIVDNKEFYLIDRHDILLIEEE